MAKAKKKYLCTQCNYESPKWQGKCPDCESWNSFTEIIEEAKPQGAKRRFDEPPGLSIPHAHASKAINLSEVDPELAQRIDTKDEELNRVLGGGLVPGSVVLLAGEPGIGKSTLVLQLALSLKRGKVLYVSGEESSEQIKKRALRLASNSYEHVLVLNETEVEQVAATVKPGETSLIVIDSIQTMNSRTVDSSPGTVSQIRESADILIGLAKRTHIPVLLIGHITKEGAIAGPKLLEHMVDTVLTFEGDRHLAFRIIRTSKNRFGATSEIGIYEMLQEGLLPVKNPSEIMLSQKEETFSGIAIGSVLEGNRSFLVEVQALVTPSFYAVPQRSATGFDQKRLAMLLAVLEKRLNFKLSQRDIFINVAGGFKVSDPGLDLAVCAAIVSSFLDQAIPETSLFVGEVGLGGEVRPVPHIEIRLKEAQKLGFSHIIIPHGARYNSDGINIRVDEIASAARMVHGLFTAE